MRTVTEAPEQPPRRGRGRPPRLTRDEIVRAARALLEREGIEALTMRGVAREVGSAPMGLYHHVADKDELLVLLLDAEASELETPPLPADPRERIVVVAMTIHAALDQRPWVLEALTPDRFGRSALNLVEEIVGGFVACGLELPDAVRAYRSLWYLIVGELTFRHAGQRRAAAGDGRSRFAEETFAGIDPGQLPLLARVAPDWWDVMDDYAPADHLAAFVDGLIARYARAGSA